MEKFKSLRNAVIALLIFGLLAYICYGAIFVVLAVQEGSQAGLFLLNHVKEIIYVLGFQAQCYLALAINSYLLLLLLLIMFALMLTFSIIKGKGTMVLPWIMSAFSIISFVEVITNLSRYTIFDTSAETGKTGYVALFESESLATKIMALALLVMIIIATLVSVTSFFVAFIYTLIYKKEKKAKVIARKAIPQEDSPYRKYADAPRKLAFEEEPEPEPTRQPFSKEELVEIIRQVIKEEMGEREEKPNPQQVLSSPLIVQYFNGLNSPVAEEPKEEEPVQEEPQPEPEPEPVVEEALAEEPAIELPVEEPAPEPEKKVIVRIPFQDRITNASDEMKKNFNELKNEIMAYGVNSRVSNSGDTFRLHRKTFVKITIAGKSLKLYFALNPADYMSSTFPIGNAGDKNIYAEIPLIFKVKSGLSVKRAKQLIYDVMSQNNLEQGEVGNVDYIEEIANQMKEGQLSDAEDDDAGQEDED